MRAEREQNAPEQETTTFSRALAALREEGSNLLLVGPAHDTVRLQACQRFLGEPGDEPRRRLFVQTEPRSVATDVMRESYTQSGPRSTKVIEQLNQHRGTAAQSSPADTPIPRTVISEGDLTELGDAIVSAISSFDSSVGGLDPAEFRMCLDSLQPLFANHDRQSVFQFLHVVTASVKDVGGMAHYHFPVEFDSETIDLVSPLFDAVVEIRIEDSYPQQRWHLAEEGVTTDWLSL